MLQKNEFEPSKRASNAGSNPIGYEVGTERNMFICNARLWCFSLFPPFIIIIVNAATFWLKHETKILSIHSAKARFCVRFQGAGIRVFRGFDLFSGIEQTACMRETAERLLEHTGYVIALFCRSFVSCWPTKLLNEDATATTSSSHLKLVVFLRPPDRRSPNFYRIITALGVVSN